MQVVSVPSLNVSFVVKHFLTFLPALIAIIYSSSPTPPVGLRPNAGHGLLIHEVSRSHTTTKHSR